MRRNSPFCSRPTKAATLDPSGAVSRTRFRYLRGLLREVGGQLAQKQSSPIGILSSAGQQRPHCEAAWLALCCPASQGRPMVGLVRTKGSPSVTFTASSKSITFRGPNPGRGRATTTSNSPRRDRANTVSRSHHDSPEFFAEVRQRRIEQIALLAAHHPFSPHADSDRTRRCAEPQSHPPSPAPPPPRWCAASAMVQADQPLRAMAHATSRVPPPPAATKSHHRSPLQRAAKNSVCPGKGTNLGEFFLG